MDAKTMIFISYAALGLIFILFNKKISNIIYSLTLYYTEKLRLKDLFLFKVDDNNRNSMYFLTKNITISLGLLIFATSLYYLYI